MILGEVVGRVWSERQVAGLQGRRLVSVRTADDVAVAVDLIEVGPGNLVLLATDEAAQVAAGGDGGGIDAAVVALVGGADELATLMAPGQAGGAP